MCKRQCLLGNCCDTTLMQIFLSCCRGWVFGQRVAKQVSLPVTVLHSWRMSLFTTLYNMRFSIQAEKLTHSLLGILCKRLQTVPEIEIVVWHFSLNIWLIGLMSWADKTNYVMSALSRKYAPLKQSIEEELCKPVCHAAMIALWMGHTDTTCINGKLWLWCRAACRSGNSCDEGDNTHTASHNHIPTAECIHCQASRWINCFLFRIMEVHFKCIGCAVWICRRPPSIKVWVSGCLIGLPRTFDADTVLDVDVYLNGKPVDMSSPAGQSMAEAALLSDDAKKFLIAREVSAVLFSEASRMAASTASHAVTLSLQSTNCC